MITAIKLFIARFRLYVIAASLVIAYGAGWQSHVIYTGYQESKRLKDAAKTAGDTNRKEAGKLNSNQEIAHALDDAIRNSNTDDDAVFKCLWIAIREGRAKARCVPKDLPTPAESKPAAKPVP